MKIPTNDVPLTYLESTSTPDGKEHHQLQTSIKHAREGTCIVNTTALNKYYLSVYNTTHLLPKLIYPLTYASFTYEQIEQVHKTYIPTSISAMTFNRTWPIDLRYGIHHFMVPQLKYLEV